MKRIVFLLALLYGPTLMAQNKAVAVTEVVDKEDKVSYATEIMVRTRLTAAISMKQGYTAYDRVDLQSIMSEQNFQRTGLVDGATIKRLGEMTGASLILIPEVAMSDDGKIYVAVKMLDVTTAQTLMSTGELMGSSSAEVEEGCRALTAKVLGVRSGTSSTTVGSDEPVTLFGYLRVFPTDIGEFQTLPAQLLSGINSSATYGYDSWRLPTTEELSMIRANSHLIPNFKNADYLCSDSYTKGFVRLVTTDASVTEKAEALKKQKEIRRKAIFNLLDIHRDFEDYIITDTCVIYTCKLSTPDTYREAPDYNHQNPKFKLSSNESLIGKHISFSSDSEGYLIRYSYGRMKKPSPKGINPVRIVIVYNYTLLSHTGNRVNKKVEFVLYEQSDPYDVQCVEHNGGSFNFSVLYTASLPPDILIQKEMQRLLSQ